MAKEEGERWVEFRVKYEARLAASAKRVQAAV